MILPYVEYLKSLKSHFDYSVLRTVLHICKQSFIINCAIYIKSGKC